VLNTGPVALLIAKKRSRTKKLFREMGQGLHRAGKVLEFGG
jgi:hypothetical protein